MSSTLRPSEVLDITGLRDAMSIGLDLLDLFGSEGFSALWLGETSGVAVDFLVLTAERATDVRQLVRYATVCGDIDPSIERAVLWRRVDAIHDLPVLAGEFFERRDQLDQAGVELVDEIALTDDEVRSMAVSTLSDGTGWDDVTDLLGPPDRRT